MDCQEFQLFADAYVDGEFSDRESAEMQAHLRQCESCRARIETQIQFKEHFKAVLSQVEAPDSLRQKIYDGIDAANEDESKVKSWAREWKRYAAVGGSLAASVALLILFVPSLTVLPASSEQLPVADSAVDWHRGDYPTEIEGPQSHEVAQWFRGKVDFPVHLPTFAEDDDVELVGGRIAHIQDRRAAYALYDVEGARLSVMVFHGDDFNIPSDNIRRIGDRDVALLNQNGYEVAVLQDNGITYTMTSDLPKDEMLELVDDSLQR